MRLAGSLVVLVAASVAMAEPPVVTITPDQLKPVNGYVTFIPGGNAKAVSYVALDGVYPVPSQVLADKRSFCLPVQTLPVGTYRFVATGSLNDEHTQTEFSVVIGTPPVPPKPPDPKPPDPPTPPPDEATAALTRTFQAAYNADDDTIKETKLSLLTRIMDEAAVQINAKDAKGVYLVTTLKQFADAVHVVTNQQISSAAIPKLRGSVGVYLNSKLPTVDAPLTEESRAKVAAAYTQVAKSLKGVKP